MIIGLTGPMASGKSTVVNALKNRGFKSISLSDMVREEARNQGLEETRDNLMSVGQYMRGEFGPSILGKRVREKIQVQSGENWIVDGIRNPAEVLELRKLPNFVLIANEAPEDLIVQRILDRKRSDDTLDEKTIRKKLRREMGQGEPAEGQQVLLCMEMADYHFKNTMPMDEVETEFLKLYNKIIADY